jgi:hypothetical protein
MANLAFLRNNVVAYIAQRASDLPASAAYDASRDATGANVGDTWNGSAYVAPPVPPERANENTLRDNLRQALSDNKAFLAIASPTNAQLLAQIKPLTRQVDALMRIALGQFDGTD